MTDKLTPRQRLSHKLRDGKYRAKRAGCKYEHVDIVTAWAWLIEFQGCRCNYCHKSLENEPYALDHIKPLSKGGEHYLGNLALSCMTCNKEKFISLELDFLARLSEAA